MTLFKNKYRVETMRLQSWDYTWGGWYYITICTKHMSCWFGAISSEIMNLSAVGNIAFQCWSDIPKHFATTELDEFQIMPNHLHGIVFLYDPSPNTIQPTRNANLTRLNKRMSEISPKPGSVGAIVRSNQQLRRKLMRKASKNSVGKNVSTTILSAMKPTSIASERTSTTTFSDGK